MNKQVVTYKYRIKDSTQRNYLKGLSSAVNFVWNYCKQTDLEFLENTGKHLTGYDLQVYTKGCSQELGLSSKTIQQIGHEYCTKRKRFKKRSLNWRSSKRNLSWIPFDKQQIKHIDGTIRFSKRDFKLFYSRSLDNVEILGGSFTEDSKGRWYINLIVTRSIEGRLKTNKSIGIDLGLKAIAVTSEGDELSRQNYTKLYAKELALAQRAGKKKRVIKIHQKIKNKRSDWNNKVANNLTKKYDKIVVGDVSSSKLAKTKMAKSVYDASWFGLKSALGNSAIKRGVDFQIVKESYSTVTCSSCKQRTGPSGLGELGVREWVCSSCGIKHNRDHNAAKNILHNSVQGIAPKLMESYCR